MFPMFIPMYMFKGNGGTPPTLKELLIAVVIVSQLLAATFGFFDSYSTYGGSRCASYPKTAGDLAIPAFGLGCFVGRMSKVTLPNGESDAYITEDQALVIRQYGLTNHHGMLSIKPIRYDKYGRYIVFATSTVIIPVRAINK